MHSHRRETVRGGRGGQRGGVGGDIGTNVTSVSGSSPATSGVVQKGCGRDDAPLGVISNRLRGKEAASSFIEDDQDGFLELARQIAALAVGQTKSHESLAGKVAELETVLACARKDLADLRVKNDRLARHLLSNVALGA